MLKGTKMRRVLVLVLNVSSDGFPVDEDGEECAVSGKPALYTWEVQRRSEKWLADNRNMWKELPNVTADKDLFILTDEIAVWAAKTFPDESVEGKLEHLKEEVEELLDDPDDLGEWADCFMLLFDAARKKGLAKAQIIEAMRAKFEVNKTRTWRDVGNGVHKHVEA